MNKRNLYLFRGEWKRVQEIASILGVHKNTVYNRRIGDRIGEGDELLDPYSEPPPNAVMIQFAGERLCVAEWARRFGINRRTLQGRLRKGWPIERALTEPPHLVGSNSGSRRNQTLIRRIATTVRRERTTEVIHRIASSLQTGGYRQTFDLTRRTGEDRHETHFEGSRA